uniref:SH2 domain-containing protein n=1 Tax=Romanomermis culicivorax TaxID=13658 RepID=A0A915JIR1_ROMCU
SLLLQKILATRLYPSHVDSSEIVVALVVVPGDYSVSLKAAIKNKHFWIRVDQQKFFNIGNRKFSNLDELIKHYMEHPIFTGDRNERLYLIKPLPSTSP